MKTHHLIFLCLFLFSFFLIPLQAQDKPGIYIDCQMRCDYSYIKQEIRFVNYMLNRQEADIFVLATYQRTGAGGREVQLAFLGSQAFEGLKDTMIYFVDPNATDAMEREQLVKELKKGLLQFLIRTPMIDKIEYSITESTEEENEQSESEKDPWNYWVFSIGGRAWLNGEESYKNIDLSGRLSASRVTDQHKFRFSARYDYDESIFTLTDGEQFSSLRRNYSARIEYVKSQGPKWSIGFQSRLSSSTFGNTDLSGYVKPAIEYNIFPYSEAQTKRFSFMYSIGPEYYNYTDTTIFDKLTETRMRHGLEIEFVQTQKWGDIEIDIGVQQYLHNLSQYNAYLNPDIEWQVFKGLRLELGGYISFVSDRINIAKLDITDEDILLQIKQLDTNFYLLHLYRPQLSIWLQVQQFCKSEVLTFVT